MSGNTRPWRSSRVTQSATSLSFLACDAAHSPAPLQISSLSVLCGGEATAAVVVVVVVVVAVTRRRRRIVAKNAVKI